MSSEVERLGCRREFPERSYERCGAAAEFIVWGKLFPKEALGPRCRNCVDDQCGPRASSDPSYAVYKLPDLDAIRERVREELQEAFDHILKGESKLPGLHDIFDRVFPGWRHGREAPDSHCGPLGDGPSFAHDVKPLEEELALAKEHPEYGIDVAAVEAALREAKADAARKGA